MYCPKCHREDTRVVDSRPEKERRAIRRRRLCEGCGFRFSTIERILLPRFLVKKRNGTTEEFSEEKLEQAIRIASRKRPLSRESIHELVRDLSEQWASREEVTSAEIGDAALAALRATDEIACLRFASVYQQFENLQEFRQKLEEIEKKPHLKKTKSSSKAIDTPWHSQKI